MSDVLIIGGARTPMGGLLGDLSEATANELGTTAIAATLERTIRAKLSQFRCHSTLFTSFCTA